jgi:hypothetical protein
MGKVLELLRERRIEMARWFRRHGFMLAGYLFMLAAGISVIVDTPSPALSRQGGPAIVAAWATLCIAGGTLGIVGVLAHKAVADVTGAGLCSSACLVWGVSVVLQAVSADTKGSATAACVAFAIASLFLRRFVDVMQPTE